jgi:creatinine amidohydrolase
MKLAELTWPDVDAIDRDSIILYPIAALEQHSRHLPFFTDSILCESVAAQIETSLPNDVLLLPLQWLGASSHHLGMAGTLSLENETYLKLLCEPLRCLLRNGFRRVFILNGHGGNVDAFHLALRQLAVEFPLALLGGASYWDLAEQEIAVLLKGKLKTVGHACEFETSLMMYLRPYLVRTSQISNDGLIQIDERLSKVYVPLDMKRQTRHGGTGEPTHATRDTGKALFQILTARAVETLIIFKTAPVPRAP